MPQTVQNTEDLTQGEALSGTVEHIVFRNEDNGWTVLELDTGDQIVIAAALSFICSMGDLMPPTALAGNYAAQIVEQKYSRVLRHCAIPFIVCILYGLVTLLVSGNLSFLT